MIVFRLLFLITFFMTHQGFSQKKGESILRIRQDFRTINTDSTLKVIVMDAEDFLENAPDGGGELRGFYKKGNLVKVTVWIGLSLGNSVREFYLKDGEVFFVYEKFDSFVQTGEVPDKSRVVTSFEGRYYILKNKIIEEKLSGKIPLDKTRATISLLKEDVEEYRMKLSAHPDNS